MRLGSRRLDRADDVHRQEIVVALSRNHITVIPVRVDGVAMPTYRRPARGHSSLTDQQSHELSDSSARREVDLKLLIADIERLTGLKSKQGSSGQLSRVSSAPGSRKQWLGTSVKTLFGALVASMAVLVMAEIALGWTFSPPEISLIVLIVLGITILGAGLRARWKEKSNNART